MKRLWNRYREFILYCVFGGMTFLVDTGVFYLFVHHTSVFHLQYSPAIQRFFAPIHIEPYSFILHACSIISTLTAITFAYVTNRKFVFQSKSFGCKNILKEMGSFYAARIFTLVLAEVLMQITDVHMGFDELLMKFSVNIIVIALNYIFSKVWIFRKPALKDSKQKES